MFTFPATAVILFFKAEQFGLFGATSTVSGYVNPKGKFVAPYQGTRHHAVKKPKHPLSGHLFAHADDAVTSTHVQPEPEKKPVDAVDRHEAIRKEVHKILRAKPRKPATPKPLAPEKLEALRAKVKQILAHARVDAQHAPGQGNVHRKLYLGQLADLTGLPGDELMAAQKEVDALFMPKGNGGGSGGDNKGNGGSGGSDKPPGNLNYSSSEIPADKNDAHAYRVAAQAIAQPRYVNKPPIPVTVSATQEEIQVSWRGIKHVLRDGQPSWQESLAALHVEELLQGAKKTGVEPDRLGRKDPIAVHRYQATANFDGNSHQVTLVVREHTDGKRYYDHSIIETKTPAGLPVSSAEKTASEPAPPFAGAETTLPPPAPEGKPEKQPWQMTRKEFGYGDANDWPLLITSKGKVYGEAARRVWAAENPDHRGPNGYYRTPEAAQKWVDKTHRRIVKEALRANQPVPPEVLADYPDLKPKPKVVIAEFPKGKGDGKGNGGSGGEPPQEQGPFGPIFRQFRHDAPGAIAHLKQQQTGEAVAALHHPEVGDIDLVWGKEGTEAKDYEDGHGLAKIITKHPEVLNNLQGILDTLKGVPEKSTNAYKVFESYDHKALIRLDWDRKAKTWLLTAFEKKDKEGAGSGTIADTARINGQGDTARLTTRSKSTLPPPAPEGKDESEKPIPDKVRASADKLLAPVKEAITAIQDARKLKGPREAAEAWKQRRAAVADTVKKIPHLLASIPDNTTRSALRRYFSDQWPNYFVTASEASFVENNEADDLPRPDWVTQKQLWEMTRADALGDKAYNYSEESKAWRQSVIAQAKIGKVPHHVLDDYLSRSGPAMFIKDFAGTPGVEGYEGVSPEKLKGSLRTPDPAILREINKIDIESLVDEAVRRTGITFATNKLAPMVVTKALVAKIAKKHNLPFDGAPGTTEVTLAGREYKNVREALKAALAIIEEDQLKPPTHKAFPRTARILFLKAAA